MGIPSSESTIGDCPANRIEESSYRSVTIVEYDSVEGDFEPEGACLHYDGGEMGEVRTDQPVRAPAIPLTVELSLELPSTRDNYQEIDVGAGASVASSL
jgi:hypothetical protein